MFVPNTVTDVFNTKLFHALLLC